MKQKEKIIVGFHKIHNYSCEIESIDTDYIYAVDGEKWKRENAIIVSLEAVQQLKNEINNPYFELEESRKIRIINIIDEVFGTEKRGVK